MHPICQLLLKATRVDSPPFDKPGSIAQFRKSRRSEANLSQSDLAEKLGLCKKTVWNWEAGLTKPTGKLWQAVVAFAQKV
jgi:DNA-binding transcriptional regulator YiaG